MTTAKELREHCEKLRTECEEDLKSVLNDYFESVFIAGHRPFRAVIGNEKCKPIPIHRDFVYSEETFFGHKFTWPNLSEEMLRKELENLGFIITKFQISIMVPPFEKGKKLSFAQEWVKRINYSYSEYCANEQRASRELYSEFLSALFSTPAETIRIYDGYTLFCGFEFDCKISSKCKAFIRRLMLSDGIEEYYENGEYKGIRVLRQLPIK